MGRRVGAWVRSLSYPCRVLICMRGRVAGLPEEPRKPSMCEARDAADASGDRSNQVASGLPSIQLLWSCPSLVPGMESMLQKCSDCVYGSSQWRLPPRPLVGDNSQLSPQ